MTSIFILAAENSAERYAAQVVAEFKRRSPDIAFFGVGGEPLRQLGADIILHNREFAIVGIVEIITSIFKLKYYMHRILREISKRKPAAVLLIDYPDFNLRLARKIKKMGIPVFYYISPTVWAWRYSRVNLIRKYIEHIFIIFPFEVNIYEKEKIPFTYTGHPLVSTISVSESCQSLRKRHDLETSDIVIALLPGSRRSEIQFLLPEMVKTIKPLQSEFNAKFLLVRADSIDGEMVEKMVRNTGIEVVGQDEAYNVINASDVVVTTCGTSNLEIAMIGTPFVAVYRVNRLSYLLGKRFVKIDRYSIVNILAGKEVITELIQKNFQASKIIAEVRRIISHPGERARMARDFETIRQKLEQHHHPAAIIYDKMNELLSFSETPE